MLVKLLLAALITSQTIPAKDKEVPSVTLDVPVEYKGPAYGAVFYLPPLETDKACGNKDPKYVIYACASIGKGTGWMILPNPCGYPEAKNKESFAYLACHEKAHWNGWKHD